MDGALVIQLVFIHRYTKHSVIPGYAVLYKCKSLSLALNTSCSSETQQLDSNACGAAAIGASAAEPSARGVIFVSGTN